VTRHAQYSFTSTVINDVALLTLCNRAEFNDLVAPACLPHKREHLEDGEEVVAVGWGAKFAGGPPTSKLKEARVFQVRKGQGKAALSLLVFSQVPLAQCRQPYLAFGGAEITPDHICAGHSGADSCDGDSGGPLMARRRGGASNGDDQWVIVGITSFGIGCNDPKFPGVYAKVTPHLKWIKKKLKQNNRISIFQGLRDRG